MDRQLRITRQIGVGLTLLIVAALGLFLIDPVQEHLALAQLQDFDPGEHLSAPAWRLRLQLLAQGDEGAPFLAAARKGEDAEAAREAKRIEARRKLALSMLELGDRGVGQLFAMLSSPRLREKQTAAYLFNDLVADPFLFSAPHFYHNGRTIAFRRWVVGEGQAPFLAAHQDLLLDPDDATRQLAADTLYILSIREPTLFAQKIDRDRIAALASFVHPQSEQAPPRLYDLLQALGGDESAPVRLQALWAIERYRYEGPEVVRALVRQIEDRTASKEVRQRAIALLSERGLEGAEVLRRKVREQDVQLAAAAVRGLGTIGGKDDIPHLIDVLGTDDPELRAAALTTLCQISATRSAGDLAAWKAWWDQSYETFDAAEARRRALRDLPELARPAACYLGLLGRRDATMALRQALKEHDDPAVRRACAEALARLRSIVAVDDLIAALEDADERVRVAAALALQTITGQAFGSIRERFHELREAPEKERLVALERWKAWRLASRFDEPLEWFRRGLQAEDASVKVRNLRALATMQEDTALVAKEIAPYLADPAAPVRHAALDALSHLPRGPAVDRASLMRIIEDQGGREPLDVRVQAVRLLCLQESTRALPELLRLLSGGSDSSYDAVIRALRSFRDQDLDATGVLALIGRIADQTAPQAQADPMVRQKMAQALGALGLGLDAAIAEAQRQEREHPLQAEQRSRSYERLRSALHQRAVPALIAALSDEVQPVRWYAIRALMSIYSTDDRREYQEDLPPAANRTAIARWQNVNVSRDLKAESAAERAQGLRNLLEHGEHGLLPEERLIEIMGTDEPPLRLLAARIFMKVGGSDAADILHTLLLRNDPRITDAIVEAARASGYIGLLPILDNELKKSNPDKVILAAGHLGRLGAAGAPLAITSTIHHAVLPQLFALLAHTQVKVREAGAEAIKSALDNRDAEGYRADAPAPEREAAIARWRKKAELD